MKKLLVFSILIFPVLVAGTHITCKTAGPIAGHDGSGAYWNDVARYLAGLPVDEKSVLHARTLEPHYREHARFMNGLWERIQKETVDLIRPWRDKNVPSGGSTAFYPLSGADFINLYCLYPDARNYIMIAMERPGDAALLADHASRRLTDGLLPIQRSIYLYGVNNYFQSKVMMREMNNTLLPGTAPVLLIFMARLGLTITGVENICIGDTGTIVPLPPSGQKDAGAAVKRVTGTRITFRKSGERRTSELVYLCMKIEPGSVDEKLPEGRFFNRLKGLSTMLKSAVYILHYKTYEPVRDFILTRSDTIVEDDSGIPYSSFTGRWKIKLYGVYRPYMALGGCRPVMQDDLKKSYKEESYPLPFNFGYGILHGAGQSNLMVARKR